jgi:hypothetical protein
MKTTILTLTILLLVLGNIVAQDLTRKDDLLRFASEQRLLEQSQKAEAVRKADSLGIPMRYEDEGEKSWN